MCVRHECARDACNNQPFHAGQVCDYVGGVVPLPPGVADDWVQVVTQAMASNVCNQVGDGGKCNPAAP